MAHWEYRLVPIGSLGRNQEEALNELGQEGWELAGDLQGMPGFKRPRRPTPRPDAAPIVGPPSAGPDIR